MAYIGSQPTKVVSQQSSRVYRYTATAGQTAFSGADVDNQVLNVTPSDVEVHMNGLLLDPTDYTATSSSVTLGTAANAGDELTVTGMVTFEVADTYNKATADARYVDVAGDTMTGALALPSGGFTVGTDQLAVDSSGRVTMADQPAFLAYSSTYSTSGFYPFTSFNISSTGGFNRGNHFNLSTGVLTVPVSGLYQINYVFHDTVNTSTRKIGRVYLNNAAVSWGEVAEATSIYSDVGGALVLNLSANDTVQWATHPLAWGAVTASAFLIG